MCPVHEKSSALEGCHCLRYGRGNLTPQLDGLASARGVDQNDTITGYQLPERIAFYMNSFLDYPEIIAKPSIYGNEKSPKTTYLIPCRVNGCLCTVL